MNNSAMNDLNNYRIGKAEAAIEKLTSSCIELKASVDQLNANYATSIGCEKRVEAIEKIVLSHQEIAAMFKKAFRVFSSKKAKSLYLAVGGYVVAKVPEWHTIWAALKPMFLTVWM
jgi:hypothetical protein